MPGRILVLNPGSTSTKIALFAGREEEVSETLRHSSDELAAFATIADQAPMRAAAIDAFLAGHLAGGPQPHPDDSPGDARLEAVVARGGLLKPVTGGVYRVNEAMVADLRSCAYGSHASNLGGVLALDLAVRFGCPAFIADPVVVDELHDVSRLSGVPQLPRRSIFHALNQKSAAREVCARLGRAYEECNLIVAHMGGGISVGAHERGRVVDVNNALDGEGPFSPERAGTVPAGQLAELVAGGGLDLKQIRRLLTGGGGLVAYLGTNSVQELLDRAGWTGTQTPAGAAESAPGTGESPPGPDLVLRAMCYQVAKEIAMHGATLCGEVDAIVLTGGIAHNEEIVERITRRVAFLAPVHVVPGEREMVSLAAAAVGALDGSREIQTYG